MTKQIPLSQGKVALVDDTDFEWLNQWKWYAAKNSRNGKYYARRVDKNKKVIYMHRVIMNAPTGMEPDHINHDGLDNQRSNLRLATRIQNAQNIRARSISGYRGVRSHRDRKSVRYFASIRIGGKEVYLGSFVTAEEAARAWDSAAKKHLTKFAQLNFPESSQ